jgi:TonB family protein
MLRDAGLYQPPEIPTGCLDWSGVPKGDSVLFRPVMSRTGTCAKLDPVEDVWIVPRDGATAFLVDGADRTDLKSLTGAKGSGRAALDKLEAMNADMLEGEDVDPSEPNMIDVILAGGGGSIKKGERAEPERNRTPGAQAGFGMGEGGKRQGRMVLGEAPQPTSTERARISPAKASDIELAGEGKRSRTPESILRVIRQHTGSFQYTYQKYLRDNPGVGGRISLRFTIAPSGDIIALSVVESNTGHAELDDEIKNKARRMKFDEVEGSDLTVTYRFKLDRN